MKESDIARVKLKRILPVSSSHPDHAPQRRADAACHGTATDTRGDPALPVHDADDLLGGGKVALIVLGTETYRLRLTRQGKLILNK